MKSGREKEGRGIRNKRDERRLPMDRPLKEGLSPQIQFRKQKRSGEGERRGKGKQRAESVTGRRERRKREDSGSKGWMYGTD